MSVNYNDFITDDVVSECCGASILGLDDDLGHCSECGEWTSPAPLDIEEDYFGTPDPSENREPDNA